MAKITFLISIMLLSSCLTENIQMSDRVEHATFNKETGTFEVSKYYEIFKNICVDNTLTPVMNTDYLGANFYANTKFY